MGAAEGESGGVVSEQGSPAEAETVRVRRDSFSSQPPGQCQGLHAATILSVTQFPPSPTQILSLGPGWVTSVALGERMTTIAGPLAGARADSGPGCRRVPPSSPSVSLSPCLTAADAPALQEKGIKLGWRNFKDCCRPEGLRSPRGDGQSCRINPIGSLARLQPVQSSRRARGSAGGDAGGG